MRSRAYFSKWARLLIGWIYVAKVRWSWMAFPELFLKQKISCAENLLCTAASQFIKRESHLECKNNASKAQPWNAIWRFCVVRYVFTPLIGLFVHMINNKLYLRSCFTINIHFVIRVTRFFVRICKSSAKYSQNVAKLLENFGEIFSKVASCSQILGT